MSLLTFDPLDGTRFPAGSGAVAKKSSCLSVVWSAIAVLLPLTVATAATLNIEGTASYTSYTRQGAVSRSFTGHFSLQTDSSRWKVKYADDKSKTEGEAVFDGRYTYTLWTNFPLTNSFQSPAQMSIFTNAEIGAVYTFQQPTALFGSAQVAWMSFLASGWISNPPSHLFPPWPITKDKALAYKTQVHHESTNGQTGFAQIEFITSQKLWLAATPEPEPNVPTNEFVEARLRVLAGVAFENKYVPTEAVFERFWFPDIRKQTEWSLRSVIRTKVSKHYLSSEAISLPALSKKTQVSDSRFKGSNTPDFIVYYELTNKTWIDEKDPRLVRWAQENLTNYQRMQKELQRRELHAKGLRQSEKARETKHGLIVAILIFFGLIGPVLVLLFRNRKKTRQNPKPQ